MKPVRKKAAPEKRATVDVLIKLTLGLCTDAHSKFVYLTTRFLGS